MNIRVGFGYDVHQLAPGHRLVIGGVEIQHEKGSVAHSDGDVLIHAICDALLGAANLRDIGHHFPDTSDNYKDISSLILLKKTNDLLRQHGYLVGNVDTTLCLQRPKIKDAVPEMIRQLATALETDAENISVKATTTEKLGFVGEEKGIEAYAVALIYKA
jgi:2-C-methyl-D-erythritol 2,4-cyclodiphosphate synthase